MPRIPEAQANVAPEKRELMLKVLSDHEFESYAVKSFKVDERAPDEPPDEWCSLEFEEGSGIGVRTEDWKRSGYTPQPGDTARLYGRGLGYPVRGIVIFQNPQDVAPVMHILYYRTAAEDQALRDLENEGRQQEKRAKEQTERPDRDRRRAALPAVLQARLARLERNVGADAWRVDSEPYELFVCEQAALIYFACADEKEIRGFSEAAPQVQKTLVPTLDYENHSGNTFSQAVRTAFLMRMEKPDIVERMHAAICPLMGCEDSGCYAAEPEVKAQREREEADAEADNAR